MPTYADEIAARQAAAAAAAVNGAYGSNGSSSRQGPVRLTISRGDAFVGPNGETLYREEWEEEEIMETELVDSVDSELGTNASTSAGNEQHGSDGMMLETLATTLSAQDLGGALLVLDTNTLLYALPLLTTLFEQCLARNSFALENARFDRSPISLIVPHVVLSELDGLKSMRSRDHDSKAGAVASKAQAVNRWILSALRMQKKQAYHASAPDGNTISQAIPESAWALHVESSAHARARDVPGSSSLLSADEEIVRFCISLQAQTGLAVSFCSDDVNARLRAESDGLATFTLTELMRDLEAEHNGTQREALEKGAIELIEQWAAQLGVESATAQDEYPSQGVGASQYATAPTISSMDVETQATHISQGNGMIPFAAPSTANAGQRAPLPPMPSTSSSRTNNVARKYITVLPNDSDRLYDYPTDRSTASSRWARS